MNFALFDTALGPCGILWGERGIAAVQLPELNRQATRARLLRQYPAAQEAAAPAAIAQAIAGIQALLAGDRSVTFSDAKLDTAALPAFHRRVYAVICRLRPGETMTYGAIAAELDEGEAGDARAVGHALGKNPIPVIIPCHRVVAANGKLGGFSAPGGRDTKLKLLAIEGGGAPDNRQPSLF